MRADNAAFEELNNDQQREPSFVVEIAFDNANTDLLYLTFDSVTGLTGANVVDGVLEKINGTTQKLNPDKALSTIGSLSFSAVDNTLTATQKTKLEGGDGLRGKRVRYYVGAAALDWADFVLAQTQRIDTVTYKDNVYSFKCADVQREMRKDIFDPKKTALNDHVADDDTTITVFNTAGFELVQHPSTVAHEADAPGQEVGYIKVESGDDIEIIRYTGKTANTFTGCTRGVLGTRPITVDLPVDEFDAITSVESNAPKVTEYVYLELPAPMLAYAILTGSIYGEVGKSLPDHWHLGISTDYVKTSDFTGIGLDMWDQNNADAGVVAVIKGQEKIDGKKFVEEQIYRLLGVFSPVYSTGELGLKRMSVVHSTGSYIRILDERNVTQYGELTHDMKSVINQIVVSWNWSEVREAYTRTNILIDSDSIAQHGESDPLKLELRALEGSRHSETTLKERFDSIRDRYAGPPLRLRLTLTPDQNDLEVGDIVRVNLQNIKDYTGSETDHVINRNFEVQQVSTDWVTGRVSVSLFGSSQRAGAFAPVEEGTQIDTGFFSDEGTNIATAFAGNISSSGGITHIESDITLTGNTDLSNSGAVYYCDENLTVDSGVTVTITNNVQLRVNGFLQINGDIDGKGQGLTTGDAYFGYSISQPGAAFNTTLSASAASVSFERGAKTSIGIQNRNMTAPPFALSVNGTSIDGIPSDISGTPGEAGEDLTDTFDDSVAAAGGAGGAGGAGIMIFCDGADFGASGFINTSGADGTAGATYSNWSRTIHAGRGAGGAPGAIYWVWTKETPTNFPDETTFTHRCYYGSSDASGYTTLVYPRDYDRTPTIGDLPTGAISFYKPSGAAIWAAREPHPDHNENIFEAMTRQEFASGFVDEVEDLPSQADDVPSFTLTKYDNTPASQQGNLTTIEVSVTAPTDPNYSHAFIQYKTSLNSPWLDAGPASPEGTWVVPSDGVTYYVRALSVSKSDVISPTGPQDSITVGDVIGDPDTEAPTVMDFDAITVACESGSSVFTGKDAKFSWTDTNKDKLHFLEYKIEIKDTSTNLMRTETTKDPFYVYTYEKNKEDYETYHAGEGANRSFTIHVTVIGALDVTGGKYEGPTNSLSVSNTAPAAVGSLTVSPGYGVIYVNGTNPTDLDFVKFGIYLDTSASFTAGPSNFLGYATQLPITIASDVAGADLASGSTYYLRLESYDEFGAGSITTDYSALMAGVPAATEIPVNEVLTVDGRIIADASGDPYAVTMGPQTVDSRAALFNFKNTTTGTHYFALFENGDVEINGKVTIGSGSTGISSFSDAGALATADDISYTNVTGTKPPTDATNGATWGSNLSSIPARIAGTAGAAGLYLTDTHLGYWDGSSWQSVIESNGDATFTGDVVGGTITSSTFKSSDGNKRVEINSTTNSLSVYDSLLYKVVDLNSNGSGTGFVRTFGGGGDKGFYADGGDYGFYTSNCTNGGYFAASSSGIGCRGTATTGTGIKGEATSGYGLHATATTGHAGYFTNSSSNETIHGVNSGSGAAVRGQASSGEGGYFTNSSSDPTVYAINSSTGPGVAGQSSSNGRGVQGYSSTGYGVYGEATSTTSGYGVYGHGGDYGVYGNSNHSGGRGVYGYGSTYGGEFSGGSISVVGSGGTYGGWFSGSSHDAFLGGTGTVGSFTGSHDALFPKAESDPTLGDIVCVTSIAFKPTVSNTIPYVSSADVVESKATYGVISNVLELNNYSTESPEIMPSLSELTETEYDALQLTHKRVLCNGLGEGQINVCDDNGDIEVGDFISTSATAGKGQLYTGNDMRVVVAKAMEPVDWSAETETTKMIACIYMCS